MGKRSGSKAMLRRRELGLAIVCGVMAWVTAQGCGSGERVPKKEAKRIRALFEEGLNHKDPFVRAEAVRAIGETDAPEYKDLLMRGVKDKDLMVRAGSVMYLSGHSSEDLMAALTSVATAPDQGACRAIIGEVLSRLPAGEVRTQFVELSLRSSDAVVRKVAMASGLTQDLKRTKDEKTRERKLIPIVSRTVDASDPMVAGMALRLMESLGRSERAVPLFSEAEAGSLKARKRALKVIAEAGLSKYLPALTALSTREDFPEAARGELSIAKAASGDESVLPEVRDYLVGANSADVLRALRALSRCEGADAYRLLRSHREDSRVEIREALFRLMGDHDSVDGADFGRGLRDHEPRVIVATIEGLSKSSPRYLGPLLEKALKTRGEPMKVLRAILTALDRLEVEGALKARAKLKEALSEMSAELKGLAEGDKRLEVRTAAAEVMFLTAAAPLELYSTMENVSVEVTWAMLDALARSELREEPLKALGTFHKHQRSQHIATALISSTGVWRAYMASTAESSE